MAALIVVSLASLGGRPAAGEDVPEAQRDPTGSVSTSGAASTVYLPMVHLPDTFGQIPAIWTHATVPTGPEVALFRHTFSSAEPLTSAQLAIFADTRYEVWLDGVWIGRGPARFSRRTREYDTYALGTLGAGPHLVAVLVQWAPNDRRSESTTPFLQARLGGTTSDGRPVANTTGSDWKAMQARAWRPDSVPVHSWGSIGPTELLDLTQLPRDWMMPSFSDTGWPAAVVSAPPGATYEPRSIPLLANVPVAAAVRESGALAPGRLIGEVLPPVSEPYSIRFNALAATTFDIEVVAPFGVSLSQVVRLDGAGLSWQTSPQRHPDVAIATQAIMPGMHTLSFYNLPAQGLAFSISTQNIETPALPFQQGVHAGRRLLLAEPAPQSGEVVAWSADGLNLAFESPPAYVVLDLGRVVHGRLVADVAGPAGTVVDLGWDERLWQSSRPLPYPGSFHPEWNQTDSWMLDGSTRTISTLDARSGRFVVIAVWGSAPVQLRNIRVYEERYPVTQRGSFTSSNARLDRIWQVGVDTLYPNMVDAYADPWRERGQWWGDAYVDDHINRVAFGDTALLRRGLSLMGEAFTAGKPVALAPNGKGNHMLDYGMLWVQSLKEYYQQTHDAQFALEVYPVLREFISHLRSYENSTTRLLDLPVGHWSETVYIDSSGHANRYGQSTAVNALYYGTLKDAAALAEGVGDAAAASAWNHQAEALKQSINTYLYVGSQNRYVATVFGGVPRTPTPHAQAWALAYGIVPDAEVHKVVASLLELLSADPSNPNVEIYGMFWVLEALGRTGHIPEALGIIERYYGRLLDLGATTWWENFNAHLHFTNSLSHGWGGSPTWFLSTHVLGARRSGPNIWELRPAFSGPPAVSGRLPLRDGVLEVRRVSQSCSATRVELSSPPGAQGRIILPANDPGMILAVNGAIVWREGQPLAGNVVRQADGIYLSVGSGLYTLDVQRTC